MEFPPEAKRAVMNHLLETVRKSSKDTEPCGHNIPVTMAIAVACFFGWTVQECIKAVEEQAMGQIDAAISDLYKLAGLDQHDTMGVPR